MGWKELEESKCKEIRKAMKCPKCSNMLIFVPFFLNSNIKYPSMCIGCKTIFVWEEDKGRVEKLEER